ncbi:MEDS domain-containing protein [Actinocorallia longicatena]|uniref:STAS domain-containing protein n=1 Tax=Actinocorallia longicatena TaxID=111803 RepID=A0ABP6QQN0_9ACTN
MSRTVTRAVSAMRPGDHACFSFDHPSEQSSVVGGYVVNGLDRGERVVYLAEDRDSRVPGLNLRPGREQERYLDTGQLRVIPRSSVCGASGEYDPDLVMAVAGEELHRLAKDGYDAVRFSADWSWALIRARGEERLVRGESAADGAVGSSPVAMMLCHYDAALCPRDALDKVHSCHNATAVSHARFDDGVLRLAPTFDPHGLRVEGEIDVARHAAVTEALLELSAMPGDLLVDLTGLRFIDLRALRLLAEFPGLHRDAARLVLSNPPDFLVETIRTVGDRLPADLVWAEGRGT